MGWREIKTKNHRSYVFGESTVLESEQSTAYALEKGKANNDVDFASDHLLVTYGLIILIVSICLR